MRSSIYEIRGCYGSQKLVEIETLLDAKTASRKARHINQIAADSAGLSLRKWLEQKAMNPEGICFAARSGKDGYRYPLR